MGLCERQCWVQAGAGWREGAVVVVLCVRWAAACAAAVGGSSLVGRPNVPDLA